MDAAHLEALRQWGATIVQQAWRRYADKCRVLAAIAERERLIREEEERVRRLKAATVVILWWRKVFFWALMDRKFRARRAALDFEKAERRRVFEAKKGETKARESRAAALEAVEAMKRSGWKLGSDAEGKNYFFNWVTGESSWEVPHGWEPLPEEIWVKNMDAKGNVFYFNQLTEETAWFPPCGVCGQVEAKRVCFGCGQKNYCQECFLQSHKTAEFKDHEWKAADREKEVLVAGERHCLHCHLAKATCMCNVCRDAYCDTCFSEVHHGGALAKHDKIPWTEAKAGWQTVEGRVEGEATYYFHNTTGERTYDKPLELMLTAERTENERASKYLDAIKSNNRTIEKLQTQVEALRYEKDTKWYEQQQQKSAEMSELEELRAALQAKADDKQRASLGHMLRHPYQNYKLRKEHFERERKIYRQGLLLNKKQKAAALREKGAAEAAAPPAAEAPLAIEAAKAP